MKALYYDHDLNGARLSKLLARVAAAHHGWIVAECCPMCWRGLADGAQRWQCQEPHCSAISALNDGDFVLWLHTERFVLPTEVPELLSKQPEPLRIRGVVITSMRQRNGGHRYPPAVFNGIACVWMRMSGIDIEESGDQGIDALWEAATTLHFALDYAERFEGEAKLPALLELDRWRNEECARFFNVDHCPPVRLLATWWAFREALRLGTKTRALRNLWIHDGLRSIAGGCVSSPATKNEKLAACHGGVLVPVDLQSMWRVEHHRGTPRDVPARRADAEEWLSLNVAEVRSILPSLSNESWDELRLEVLRAAEAWRP